MGKTLGAALAIAILAAPPSFAEGPVEVAPSSLFRSSLGSPDVEFAAAGSYFGRVGTGLSVAYTDATGLAVSGDVSPFVFEQRPDLLLSLGLFSRVYLDVSVTEEAGLAGISLGYKGAPGEALKWARVGTMGIDFPRVEGIDFSGSAPKSPGAALELELGGFKADALFRYDGQRAQRLVFLGKNLLAEETVSAGSYLRGRLFAVPGGAISSLEVYAEAESSTTVGALLATDGLYYVRLDPSAYSFSLARATVSLAARPSGRILACYVQGGSEAGSSGIAVGGRLASLLYDPKSSGGFEVLSRYALPGGASAVYDLAYLRDENSLAALAGYTVVVDSKGGTAELVKDGTAALASADGRMPLGSLDPGIYRPAEGGGPSASRYSIVLERLSPVEKYLLGSGVDPTSVAVTRNGEREAGFGFNADTGELSLGVPAGAADRIEVVYRRTDLEAGEGSIVAALGASYLFSPGFSAEAAAGVSSRVLLRAYTEASGEAESAVSGVAGLRYAGDSARAELGLYALYLLPDASGRRRVMGMDGGGSVLGYYDAGAMESPWPLAGPSALTAPAEAARGTLRYADYGTASDSLVSYHDIDWTGAVYDATAAGPYLVAGPLGGSAAGAALVLDYSIAGASGWVAATVPFPDAASFARAGRVRIGLLLRGVAAGSVRVFVQAGKLRTDGIFGQEFSGEIFEKEVSYGTGADWQAFEFPLNESERAILSTATGLRFFIVATGGAASGKIAFSPIAFDASGFAVSGPDAAASALEVEAPSPSARDAFPAAYAELAGNSPAADRVLDFSTQGVALGEAARASRALSPGFLGEYRYLSFFIRPIAAPAGSVLRLRFSGASDDELRLAVPLDALGAGWSEVRIDLSNAALPVSCRTSDTAAWEALLGASVEAYSPGAVYRAASFSIESTASAEVLVDELGFEESVPRLEAGARTLLSWAMKGTAVDVGGFPLVADPAFDARGRLALDGAGALSGGASASAAMALAGVGVDASAEFASGAGGTLWKGSHALKFPAAAFPVTLADRFELSLLGGEGSRTASRATSLTLPLFDKGSLVVAEEAAYSRPFLGQAWTAAAEQGLGGASVLKLSAGLSEASEDPLFLQGLGYFDAWIASYSLFLPRDEAAADARSANGAASLKLALEPISALAELTLSESRKASLAPYRDDAARSALTAAWAIAPGSALTLKYSKEAAGRALAPEAGFGGDLAAWSAATGARAEFLVPAPVWELLAPEAASTFAASTAGLLSASWTAKGSVELGRLVGTAPADFFLPQSFSYGLSRALARDGDSLRDVIAHALSLRWASINLFGASGAAPVFDFYASDEFLGSALFSYSTPYSGGAAAWNVALQSYGAAYASGSRSLALDNRLSFSGGAAGDAWAEALAVTVGWGDAGSGLRQAFLDMIDGAARAQADSASGAATAVSPYFASMKGKETVLAHSERFSLALAGSAATPFSLRFEAGHETALKVAGAFAMKAGAKLFVDYAEGSFLGAVLKAGISLDLSLSIFF